MLTVLYDRVCEQAVTEETPGWTAVARLIQRDFQGNAKGRGKLQMVGIGRGAKSQMLLVLRHNMTDAIKVPGDSRSGGEERMWAEHMHPIFCGEVEETTEQQVKPLIIL